MSNTQTECARCLHEEVCYKRKMVGGWDEREAPVPMQCWYTPSEFIRADAWLAQRHGPEEVPEQLPHQDCSAEVLLVFINRSGDVQKGLDRWLYKYDSWLFHSQKISKLIGWYDLPERTTDG